MANLPEKVEAELEQIEEALADLPGAQRLNKLSVLELAGTASLLSSFYHGVENILKQSLAAIKVPLPTSSSWHRDLLNAALEKGLISTETRDLLVPYMAFRHFFTHAYRFEIDQEKLSPLVRDVHRVHAKFASELKKFSRAY